MNDILNAAYAVNTIDQFRAKIKAEGRTFRWFVITYLEFSSEKYRRFLNEISGYTKISDETINAIETFLLK